MIGIIIGASLALMNIVGNWNVLLVIAYIFLIPFTFMGVTRTLLGEIVSEKSTKIKEFLKLNGVSDIIYQLYCISISVWKVAIYCGFMTIGMIIAILTQDTAEYPIFTTTSLEYMIYLYLLSGLATITFTLFMSLFFKDAKFAADIGGFLYVLVSLASLAVFLSEKTLPYYLICAFPQSALTIGIVMLSKISSGESFIPMGDIYWVLLVDFLIYLILFMYLDQVMDDGNGIKKQWLFCFSRKKQRVGDDLHERFIDEESDDSSSAVYHEKFSPDSNLKRILHA